MFLVTSKWMCWESTAAIWTAIFGCTIKKSHLHCIPTAWLTWALSIVTQAIITQRKALTWGERDRVTFHNHQFTLRSPFTFNLSFHAHAAEENIRNNLTYISVLVLVPIAMKRKWLWIGVTPQDGHHLIFLLLSQGFNFLLAFAFHTFIHIHGREVVRARLFSLTVYPAWHSIAAMLLLQVTCPVRTPFYRAPHHLERHDSAIRES